MAFALDALVRDFGQGIEAVDARRPQAVNSRSGKPFQVDLGPHTEIDTVELVMRELATRAPAVYEGKYSTSVPYPEDTRSKCDLCFGRGPVYDLAVEVKMARILGDNGKPNDNLVMHMLSPYPTHRSALTDCIKLQGTSLSSRRAVIVYGYEAEGFPLQPLIEAFELLARQSVSLGQRHSARFSGLVHPVHASGSVYGWEVS